MVFIFSQILYPAFSILLIIETAPERKDKLHKSIEAVQCIMKLIERSGKKENIERKEKYLTT